MGTETAASQLIGPVCVTLLFQSLSRETTCMFVAGYRTNNNRLAAVVTCNRLKHKIAPLRKRMIRNVRGK